MRETSATTVCGTCRPLLQAVARAASRQHEPVFGARTIAAVRLLRGGNRARRNRSAGLALLAAASTLALGLDLLWRDGAWKQVTGFTLARAFGAVAFLSLRKRIELDWLGDYRFWRIVHAVVGAATLAMLFLHTGFSLGHNLNRWLMLTFLASQSPAASPASVTAREHGVLASGRAIARAL